ncbi:Lymphokine-activated killer T-cell-originated protein kinase [Daphnia magna]|uniref:Lymphokine-activated killer T-cell-originated protein kinase n=1 Tax=Daphnia magna TaxID=35525 RepID=A0A162SFN6_9CRUS|nr:Lymphokine-activated killer T-cell-originated protein kinase [Daphnia magna]
MEIWFDRKAFLGRGGYGHVLKGKYGGREVAVKRVELRFFNEKEEKALLALHHPNVVKLLHCDSDEDFRMYVLELCDASLDQLFLESNDPKKYDGPIPGYIQVFLQLALGLEHIHSKQLIHRDIKPQNVLISKTSSSQRNEVTIKWADFGLSKHVDEHGFHSWSTSGVRGTRTWYAPEVLKRILTPKEAKEVKGSVKSDVFAQGLVFGFLFLKGQHVYGLNENEIRDNVIEKKPINMKKIDGELLEIYEHNLLQKMLEDEPGKRMTSTEVVQQLKSIEKKAIKVLIELGIDKDAKTNAGSSALDLSRFDPSELLGSSKSASVYRGKYNSKDCAVKRVEREKVKECEEKVMENLKGHPNIVELLYCETEGEFVHYVLELCVASLEKLFLKPDDPKRYKGPPMPHDLHIFHQLALGAGQDAEITIKWADFGLSREVNKGGSFSTNGGVVGTEGWEAPEILRSRYDENQKPREKMLQNDPDQRITSTEVVEKLKSINENEQSTGQLPIPSNQLLKSEKAKTIGNHGRNIHTLCRYTSDSTLIDQIQRCIQEKQDLTEKDAFGWNGLHLVCRYNSGKYLIDALKILIESGIDVNVPTDGGWNALHLLCRYNSSEKLIDAMTFLIGKEINVKAKAEFGWNALHCLCSNNSITSSLNETMQLLIVSGIEVNATRNNGWNALHILCRYRSSQSLMDKIQVLVHYGIDVKTTNTRGCNALHYLCSYNSSTSLIHALQRLIKLGIDVNAKDKYGSNALSCLCQNSSSSNLAGAIQCLITNGIDVNAKDSDGYVALHYLRKLNSRKASQHLQDAIQITEDATTAQLDGQNED